MNLTRVSGIAIASLISLFGLSKSVTAQTISQVSDAPYNCYMQTEEGKIVDLGHLCGGGFSVGGTAQNNYVSGYSSSRGGNYQGSCQYSWQVDSLGRSCGERSASDRPGYNPNTNHNSSTGSIYVSPYTRSDGTYVRGHWRKK